MTLAQAEAADAAGDSREAARLYEEVLETGAADADAYLKAALMYWQSTDPGVAAARRLDRDFMARAERRHRELLSKAAQLFPQLAEIPFWQRYIAWADMGEPLSERDCIELASRGTDGSVAFLHAFALSQGERYRSEAEDLLARFSSDDTSRGRYVRSVLSAVMRHRR